MPASPSTYSLAGRVTSASGAPVAGHLVRVTFHSTLEDAAPVAREGKTDAEGIFVVEAPADLLRAPGSRKTPMATVTLLSGERPILDLPAVRLPKLENTLDIDAGRYNPDEPPRWVTGVVRDATGAPIAGVGVLAVDRDLRREEKLGETTTGAEGAYEIGYYPWQFARSEKQNADLIVQAFDRRGATLAASPIHFNASDDVEIDLTVPAETWLPPSLWERIGRTLAPLLEGIAPDELQENAEHQDVTFLAGETGFETQQIARFALAHRLALRDLPAEFWFGLLGGSFFRYDAGVSLDEQMKNVQRIVPTLGEPVVRRFLETSFRRADLPPDLEEEIDGWLRAFARRATEQMVRDDGELTFAKVALDAAGIGDKERQRRFAQIAAATLDAGEASGPTLFERLEEEGGFAREEIAAMQSVYRLAEVTGGDLALVDTIRTRFNVRTPDEVRELARQGEEQWVDVARAAVDAGALTPESVMPGVDDAESAAREHGVRLARDFRTAFPTVAFAGGLERSLRAGAKSGIRHGAALARVLDAHPDFDLLATPIDDFLDKRLDPALAETAKDLPLREELKGVQRVFKLAPNFEATSSLLAENVHSAQQVYRMGESEFVRHFAAQPGFDAESARLAWNRAADTHAAALTIVADLKAYENGGVPQALKSDDAALKNFPNWENLFLGGDLCACEECRSVLSPSAYYADILEFLNKRPARATAGTVKEILIARRPDLGWLELGCENSHTTLPYIDVVNEVLEAAIAGDENDVELVAFAAMPASPADRNAAVAAAFTPAGIALEGELRVDQVEPGDADRWVVHYDRRTWLLKKKGGGANFHVEILRNTKTSADELRAYPQYVNDKAYEKVRTAKHPLRLPFDLYGDEVRAGFRKSKVNRWELMRTLQGPAAAGAPAAPPIDAEIAAEYFGISRVDTEAVDEYGLILVAAASVAAQKERWGIDAARALADAANVKRFLDKTALEYNDLLALLDLPWINPTGTIAVSHLNNSCDTAQKRIEPLNAAAFDRLHRFLRLWRKLPGWKAWELDLVIRHPAIGKGSLDATFLTHLFHFERLRARLGARVTVEQMCGLFGDLPFRSHFTEAHAARTDGLYQTLFLNRRLINPLDPAFAIDTAGALPAGLLSAHHPVLLAALGVRESDLLIYAGMQKPDGTPYITDDLTLANLSFLWRHAWLARTLKIKAEDWRTLLLCANQTLDRFADPQTAWTFVETLDRIKQSGLTAEEVKWVLTGDRTGTAAPKESDTTRVLATLRKTLEGIRTQFSADQYAFLAAPPVDVDALGGLLTSLLAQLHRDEPAAATFVKTLRGAVMLEARVDGMPAAVFAFSAAITDPPPGNANHIPIVYIADAADPTRGVLRLAGLLTTTQRDMLLSAAVPAGVTGNPAYVAAIDALVEQSRTVGDHFAYYEIPADLTAAGGLHLPTGRASLPIRYDATNLRLGFFGVMSETERVALNANNPATLIDELFTAPRLAIKFYDAAFSTPLAALPPALDFATLLSADLAAKITYDVEERVLRFSGIMSAAEQSALHAAAPNATPVEQAWRDAVDALAGEPRGVSASDARVWLTDADLDPIVAANDTWAKRLANAVRKALDFLATTLAANAVVEQTSAVLGVSQAITRHLLTAYAIVPIAPVPAAPPLKQTLGDHLTNVFGHSTGAVDYAARASTFDGWQWAQRVALLVRKWKIALVEIERLTALAASANLLDVAALPQDATAPIASLDDLLRTHRLLRLRDLLPETESTLLEVLEKIDKGVYPVVPPAAPGALAALPVEFTADVEALHEGWLAADMQTLHTTFGLPFPGNWTDVEVWERVQRAMGFLGDLGGSAATVATYAAATMTPTHVAALKELLRAKYGAETWLTICGEIQDELREAKRDALAAYLLSRPMPADAPSGKWENTNDLFAYYLLDVEMASCLTTSRLVQASGSVQLFVQRCLMGIEPGVQVVADGPDGDSAWRWWEWMRKYRLWQANLQVWLWPENLCEPELKADRSQFFRELEAELQQNAVTPENVEIAFANYLEKVHSVAHLEVAGFYQEDDGDNTIVHVFGRTPGAEPHLYYYRRYDYRQWTPWEKVELDIQGDYLVPAVVGGRLFLFWPVFTEVPVEDANAKVKVPSGGESAFEPSKAVKRLELQLAVSEYRRGKWTPKKISTDKFRSGGYTTEISTRHFQFVAVDRGDVDGRFGIACEGYYNDRFGARIITFFGVFEISGCKGGLPALVADFPVVVDIVTYPEMDSIIDDSINMRWVEDSSRKDGNDFTLIDRVPSVSANSRASVPSRILDKTPWLFRMTPAWHASWIDRLWLHPSQGTLVGRFNGRAYTPIGSWLPFFYNDKNRTFFVLPALPNPTYGRMDLRGYEQDSTHVLYPRIKEMLNLNLRAQETMHRAEVTGRDLTTLPYNDLRDLWLLIVRAFPEEDAPPYSNEVLQRRVLQLKMGDAGHRAAEAAMRAMRGRHFLFGTFYHPFTCEFGTLVNNPLKGIPALMRRETQFMKSGFDFGKAYGPTSLVIDHPNGAEYPVEEVDFSPDGAFSPYNWELFYHLPSYIGTALCKEQLFVDGRKWYHYVFNPQGVESALPGGSATSKYWITKPFYETKEGDYVQQRIDNILHLLAGDVTAAGYSTDLKKQLEAAVKDWRTHPFDPHRIANYRTVAYQKAIFIKYFESLIAEGDNYFRGFSHENNTLATLNYVLAAELLGPPPRKIPPRTKPLVETYNELEHKFGAFANALVQVENLIPPMLNTVGPSMTVAPLPMLYFCIPHNEKMLACWETVADRLYKIRNCMDIEGVVRQMALFEPPIDPALLVKARAAGIDLRSALADLNAPLPLYRFNVLLQKANEVCADVKALGAALLGALEKKDGEALALLRQEQEIRLLKAVQLVREEQIRETVENLEGVKRSKELAKIKEKYYASREYMNVGEILALGLNATSVLMDISVAIMQALAGGLKVIPQFQLGAAGFGGSPTAIAETGGKTAGEITADAAAALSTSSRVVEKGAGMASTLAGYARRQEEWDFQRDLAEKEIEQLDRSIAAAEIRVALAQKELGNHLIQIENAAATDAFMRSKYTNEELYQWQCGQISAIFFQSYRLAFDLAKRAERCYQVELGIASSDYVTFGYWDSLKKGLLSGERLQVDLRRLENAYMEQNRREFELTKHISLSELDPLALVRLRETGRCIVTLPEEIFDLDYPGHYFRRIKSVSMTLPCVAGPYTTIPCTLRLLRNSIRTRTTTVDGYPHAADPQGMPQTDARFVESNIPVKAIATSSGQNDSGLFELNFRDERYLPLEGAGVISQWSIELFHDLPANDPDHGKALRQFDYNTITDVVLHLRYTAREDAGPFKTAAIDHLKTYFQHDASTAALRMIEVAHQFPSAWHRCLHPAAAGGANLLDLEMGHDLFPQRDALHTLKINTALLLLRGDASVSGYKATLTIPPTDPAKPAIVHTLTLAPLAQYGGLFYTMQDLTANEVQIAPAATAPVWRLQLTRTDNSNLRVDAATGESEVTEAMIVLGYGWDDAP